MKLLPVGHPDNPFTFDVVLDTHPMSPDHTIYKMPEEA